jgi:hypothetical protein
MRKQIILSVMMIIGLLICGTAFGNESGSRPQKGFGPPPTDSATTSEKSMKPSGHKPPPQAYEDCKGKKAGDTVQHTTREGKVSATCEDSPEGLVARPDQPPPGNGDRPQKSGNPEQ